MDTPSPTVVPTTKSKCFQSDDFEVQFLVMAGICILVGLTICLMGYKLFKFILFMTGFFVAFFATFVLCSLYMEDKLEGKAKEHKNQIYLALSFGAGLLAGMLTLCLYYVGIFLLGATLGWFAGMSILPFFQSHTDYIANNLWLPYSICAGSAILFGLLLLCIQRTFIIIATAFIGSLMVINGLDYYVEKGRVLNYTVHLLGGSHVDLPSCWYTWLVISFLPIIFFVGVIVQHVKTSKGADHRLASGRVLVVDAHQMYEIDSDESTRPLLSDIA